MLLVLYTLILDVRFWGTRFDPKGMFVGLGGEWQKSMKNRGEEKERE